MSVCKEQGYCICVTGYCLKPTQAERLEAMDYSEPNIKAQLFDKVKELEAKLEAAEAKLEAVGKLPDTWRIRLNREWVGMRHRHCADELKAIMEDK